MAFTKIVGAGIHTLSNVHTHNINSSGIITATQFVGIFTGTNGNFSGNLDVGGNVSIGGSLTVNGDFTTLNTTLREVEILNVDANSSESAGIITQRGSGDILNLFDTNTEVFTVKDGGKVGIGSDSPSATLDVAGGGQFKTNGASVKIESSPGTTFTQLQLVNTGGNFYIGRENSAGNWFSSGTGYASVLRSDGAYPLIFRVNSDNSMIIDSSGRVLIGTATEGQATADDLTIATSGTTGITIRSGTGNDGNIYFSDGTSGSDEFRGYVQYGHSNNSLVFGTNAGERLRILSDGKTGIGTDSPTHKVQIQDTGAYLRLLNGHESDYDLRFMTQNSEANIWHYGTDDFVIGTRYDRKFHLQQNAGKRLTIMGNGKIGINSTTPVRTMDIRPQAGSTNSDLALTASADSGSFSQLIFARPGDGYRGGVYYDHSQDQMKLYGGSQQIEIAELGGPQGYMGVGNDIGNSSNDGSWDARFNVYGANHAKMEIHQNYDDVRSHWWCHSGHAQAYIGTRSNHDFVIHTNNNIRARFTNQGAFHLFDGTYNYIESADYRIYSNTSISDGYTGAIRTVARYNTNTSLFSHSQTGGTGGASRWTFGKNCYCLLTVSQDVIGNTDSGYWWMGTKINNSFVGRHLVRKTSEWDMMTWQQSFQVSANDYLEIAWGSTAGLTAVDGTDWSHYCFMIWENK